MVMARAVMEKKANITYQIINHLLRAGQCRFRIVCPGAEVAHGSSQILHLSIVSLKEIDRKLYCVSEILTTVVWWINRNRIRVLETVALIAQTSPTNRPAFIDSNTNFLWQSTKEIANSRSAGLRWNTVCWWRCCRTNCGYGSSCRRICLRSASCGSKGGDRRPRGQACSRSGSARARTRCRIFLDNHSHAVAFARLGLFVVWYVDWRRHDALSFSLTGHLE